MASRLSMELCSSQFAIAIKSDPKEELENIKLLKVQLNEQVSEGINVLNKIAVLKDISDSDVIDITQQIEKFQKCLESINKDSDLENDCTILKDSFLKTTEKIIELWPKMYSKGIIELSESEKNFLGLEKIPAHLKKLDCTGYALLQAREPKAISWIKVKSEKGDLNDDAAAFYSISQNQAIKCLENWGYVQVKELKQGVLVVYFQVFPKIYATHTGFCKGNGEILSKTGDLDPHLYVHDVDDVPGSYGQHVLYFGKDKEESKAS
ncbi:MAG: hypothetical protein H0W88_03980 [Parachlamydiaceae bacterium]|nr:hypothetical protein [Parachlamydiaceae bacterium]